jgi:hypothetical protein
MHFVKMRAQRQPDAAAFCRIAFSLRRKNGWRGSRPRCTISRAEVAGHRAKDAKGNGDPKTIRACTGRPPRRRGIISKMVEMHLHDPLPPQKHHNPNGAHVMPKMKK